ncbi:diaminopimelate decarboxylase [Jatrophihabitans endophyticus]|uniref:Diaminopimelate decarboxylase n=1 Tax=Jatrophihabitans endophyticus TaxID=1206085 RepID=A0A1M5DM45_9ACTN|nr:diaminopimelate decarboxylase [Jatrophihabitans endophyticus]SHF67954.1 diaminopimelate decarboxylase [Jatrophihabitans endophyticus]
MSRNAHPAGPRHGDVLPDAPHGSQPGDVNALDPAIWPESATRVGGELHLGGAPVSALVLEHGTPALFLDEADVRARARSYTQAFPGIDVYYAGKAFLCTAVARWVDEEGLGLDVCTGGELAVALAAGFPAERIALHGNNKSSAELGRAVEAGVGHVIVDSFDEIHRLIAIAATAGVTQRVLVRVTVGVEAHTHEFIATAHEDQKFGFSLRDGSAARAVAAVIASDVLHFGGLHSHIGSQIFETAGFEVAAHRVISFAATIRDVHGVQVEEINLGGGLGIAYVPGDDPETPKQTLERLSGIVEIECASVGLRLPTLSVEPGRAIIGPSGVTVYEVGTVKDVTLDGGQRRRYVSVDGGMSDNIRTALYDAHYTCVLANRASAAPPALTRVVGKHCESGDVVVRDAWLPGDVRPGDLVAVAATGAYCRSMASNYNHVPRPPVVGVDQGRSQVLVRRETEDDLLRLDTGVAR